MKVLIVRAYPSLIDLSKNTYNQQEIGLAKAFLSLGHEAGIVYYGGNAHLNQTYPTSCGTIAIYYRKAKVLLNRISLFENFCDLKDAYDLIISNEYDQVETVKTVTRYAEKTVIYHGPYYAPVNRRYNLANKIFDLLFLKTIQRQSPTVVTKSKLAKVFLEGKGFAVSANVGVGLDSDQMLTAGNKYNPMTERLDSQNIHLLYIGRLEPRRNIRFLLDVLQKLTDIDPRYRLVIVGKGDADYVDMVFSVIAEKKLEPYVIYEPSLAQTQLPFLYRTCDCFLLPTVYEIWGMVLMEAMKFDLPVVTTYNGGSSSLIISGVNGYILELDADAWVNAVREGISDKCALSQYNEKVLSEMCNWKRIAERILDAHLHKQTAETA